MKYLHLSVNGICVGMYILFIGIDVMEENIWRFLKELNVMRDILAIKEIKKIGQYLRFGILISKLAPDTEIATVGHLSSGSEDKELRYFGPTGSSILRK